MDAADVQSYCRANFPMTTIAQAPQRTTRHGDHAQDS
jgi:hypothetical protein